MQEIDNEVDAAKALGLDGGAAPDAAPADGATPSAQPATAPAEPPAPAPSERLAQPQDGVRNPI
jgi:hypothetical protein